MNLDAARVVADREFVERSLDSTRSILAKYQSDSDAAGREPCYVATTGKPDWHRFYFPIVEGETYLLIVVTGSDAPTLLRSSLHIQRRVMVFLWSDSPPPACPAVC